MVDCFEHPGTPHNRPSWRRGVLSLGWAILLAALFANPGMAADLAEAEKLYRLGKYEEAAKLASEEVRNGSWVERWHLLKVKAELVQGLYPAAMGSLEDGLRRLPGSVALLLLGRDVYRLNGRDADASPTLEVIEARIQSAPSRYATP